MTDFRRQSLHDLALAFGTDKEGSHSYTAAYERHLGHLREQPIRLLEIGVGGYEDPAVGGASLRMWKAYFPAGQILGLDLYDKSGLAEERIGILRGDQGDAAFIEELGRDYGPFDVILDDGSHVSSDVITSFRALFPHLKDGGTYVIEDLQTSYWDTHLGSSAEGMTSMDLIKDLADGLNYAEFDIPDYQPTYFDLWVASITLYRNIVFIERGPNLENSNELPPHPRSKRYREDPARPDRRSGRRSTAEIVAERNTAIAERDQAVTERDAALSARASIENSHIWRATAPYRAWRDRQRALLGRHCGPRSRLH